MYNGQNKWIEDSEYSPTSEIIYMPTTQKQNSKKKYEPDILPAENFNHYCNIYASSQILE